jgi:hypothetical protein
MSGPRLKELPHHSARVAALFHGVLSTHTNKVGSGTATPTKFRHRRQEEPQICAGDTSVRHGCWADPIQSVTDGGA